MRLSELVELEEAYARRGWRVLFERAYCEDQGTTWAPEWIAQDDGTGWPTSEDAEAVCARLQKVAPPDEYRHIRVVGPAGEIVVAPATTEVPLVNPPAAPVNGPLAVAGVPDLEGALSVLAHSDDGARVLLGDQAGRAAAAPAEAVEALTAAGRPFVQPRRTAFGTMLVGDQPVAFRAAEAGAGLRADVAFVAHDDGRGGVWFVKVDGA